MKFRCERDTLAEAVTTAGRAVASRTGAMPVLSGLRLTVTGNELELVGTDLELTIRVRVPVDGDSDGSTVLPSRLFSEIVHKLDGPTVNIELTNDDVQIEAGRFATTLAHAVGVGVPSPARVGRGRCAGGRRGVCRGVAPGRAGGFTRRRPPDPHRCAAHRLGERLAPRGDRLLPARAA